jgi:hypothetical protein
MLMTIRATFDGQVFVPQAAVKLPIGSEVEISIPTEDGPLMELARIAEQYPANEQRPADYAAQADHYLYGTPKRP